MNSIIEHLDSCSSDKLQFIFLNFYQCICVLFHTIGILLLLFKTFLICYAQPSGYIDHRLGKKFRERLY